MQFLGSDGRKVDGHQSLVSLTSPFLAQVLLLAMNHFDLQTNNQQCLENTYFDCCEIVPLQVLAEHDDVEQMVTVYLPATYAAIKAFNRFVLFCLFNNSLGFIPQNM